VDLRPGPRRLPAIPGAATYLATVAGVELWDVALDEPLPHAAQLLDAGERARAARFVFDRDRARFVAGRAALRAVLAGYLGADPAGLAFVLGPHGKPAVPSGPPFSFANSHGRALCAVGLDREVGVDVEQLRDVPDADGIARSVFTAEERAAWRAAGCGSGAFLRLWTRKEAALKALGIGLGGLDGPGSSRGVELHDLALDADHVAALAVVR
jgi:4'-phosphopantetheinyl transferase